MTDDLAAYLHALLYEEEQAARAANREWRWDYGLLGVDPDADHIARWNPDRVLAEVAWKREVVKLHSPERAGDYVDCRTCRAPFITEAEPYPCPTLRLMAQPYADRDDFPRELR